MPSAKVNVGIFLAISTKQFHEKRGLHGKPTNLCFEITCLASPYFNFGTFKTRKISDIFLQIITFKGRGDAKILP
jgi:hypothetical protein